MVVVLLWILAVQWVPFHPRFDSGGYLTVATAVVDGVGYVDTAHPQLPPFVLYPPVFPATLMPLLAVGLESSDWLRITTVSWTLGVIVLVWMRAPSTAWAAATILIVGLGSLSRFATRLQTETLFTLIVTALVVVLGRWRAAGFRADRWLFLGAALLVSSVLTKNQGLGLTVGVLLFAAVEASREQRVRAVVGGTIIMGTGLVACAWWLSYAGMLDHLHPTESPLYMADAHFPEGEQRDPLSLSFNGGIFGAFVSIAFTLVPDCFFAADLSNFRGRMPVLYELMGVAVLLGFSVTLRSKRGPEHYLWMSMVGLLLLIPEREARYVLPFVVFFAEWLIAGVRAVAHRIGADARVPHAIGVLIVLQGFLGVGLGRLGRFDAWAIPPHFPRLVDLIENRTGPDDTVLVHDHYAVHILTGRHALSFHPGEQKSGESYTVDHYLQQRRPWKLAVVGEHLLDDTLDLFDRTGTEVEEVEVIPSPDRRISPPMHVFVPAGVPPRPTRTSPAVLEPGQ